MNRKSPSRQRADAEFDRIFHPESPGKQTGPTPETQHEKSERLKALRLEAERKAAETAPRKEPG